MRSLVRVPLLAIHSVTDMEELMKHKYMLKLTSGFRMPLMMGSAAKLAFLAENATQKV